MSKGNEPCMRIGSGLAGVTLSLRVSPLLLRGARPGSTGNLPLSDQVHGLSRTAWVAFCIVHGAELSVSRAARVTFLLRTTQVTFCSAHGRYFLYRALTGSEMQALSYYAPEYLMERLLHQE